MNTRSLFLLFSIAILAAGTKSFSSNMQPTSNNIQKTILTFDKISNGAEISKKDLEDARQKFLATCTETEAIGAYPAIKKIISENSKIAIHADIHGDKHAVFNFIKKLAKDGYLDKKNQFKIIKPDFYIIFTGDYVDRGPDGLEVWYILMRLRIENPDKVQILRGNHEDVSMNQEGDECFFEELKDKNIIQSGPREDVEDFFQDYSENKPEKMVKKEKVSDIKQNDPKEEEEEEEEESNPAEIEFEDLFMPIYEVLPVVLYLGATDNKNFTNYIMFTHAGIEPRFNPNKLLSSTQKNDLEYITELNIDSFKDAEFKSIIKKCSTNKIFKNGLKDKIENHDMLDNKNIGFLWSDFIVEKNKDVAISERLRGNTNPEYSILLTYGENITKKYLDLCSEKDKYQVNAIIRGHQHNGLLAKLMLDFQGIYGLWLDQDKQWDKYPKSLLEIPKYSAWTLLASPATYTGTKVNLNFDTHTILHMAKEYKDWKLQPVNLQAEPIASQIKLPQEPKLSK